jgi:hypothetical protein
MRRAAFGALANKINHELRAYRARLFLGFGPQEIAMSLFTDEGALRSFCARILGWSIERVGAVEHVLRSIKLAVAHRAALVLLGETNLVPIAHALHRRMFGAKQSFVVPSPPRPPPNATRGRSSRRPSR